MSQVRKIVLLARFTTFAGAQVFRSAPINVHEFSRVELVGWRSPGVGTDVTLSMSLEESVDLTRWTSVANSGVQPPAGEEGTAECELELPWVRISANLGGTDAVVTCWFVGTFTLRDA